MEIELKILDKRFYSEESNGMLLNPLPRYATEGSAAVDLVSTEDFTLHPQECRMIHTGLSIHIGSQSVAGIVLPRSGLGSKGLVLGNTIGLLDSDYQGEINICAWNRKPYSMVSYNSYSHEYEDEYDIRIQAGERIAQLLFVPIIKPSFRIVKEFSSPTDRGAGGFGHSGV